MRPKINLQPELDFQPSNLKLTNVYYAKYQAISRILDAHPEIGERIHRDLERARNAHRAKRRPSSAARFEYSSDTLLRILICQAIEGMSLREVVVRIDDSHFLRRFVRIDTGPMMDFTWLDTLKNAIRPETWKQANQLLARAAVAEGRISGEALRLDTTAVETHIHWPTDSWLLCDGYRVLGRLIGQARELDAAAVGERRAHPRGVKRKHLAITRKAAKGRGAEGLKPLYSQLLSQVEGLCTWAREVAARLLGGIEAQRYGVLEHAHAEALVEQLAHFAELSEQVIAQTRRRVLEGESVPNEQKLFSLFEPHTELLKRGKAGKDVEFGHMVQIQQVEQKFITDFDVFERRPAEPTLIERALEQHEQLFGQLPERLAADKGYSSQEALGALQRRIPMVAIAKKGKRTAQEREHDPLFRHAQAFRAGVEGTLSFLKRVLRMWRCFNKGWEHYAATIGATILSHNLLILARC